MQRKLPTNARPFPIIRPGDKFVLVKFEVKLVLGDDTRVQPISLRLSNEEYVALGDDRFNNVHLKKKAFDLAVRKQGQLPANVRFLDGGVSVLKESWLTATERPNENLVRVMTSGTSAVH